MSPTPLALSPVSAAVLALLNVPAVTTLATGGLADSYVPGRSGPRLWLEVREADARGLGRGALPEVELRVCVIVPLSDYQGMKLSEDIAGACVALLRDARLTVAGYTHCGEVVYEDTVPVGLQDIEGVLVNEVDVQCRLWVEAV